MDHYVITNLTPKQSRFLQYIATFYVKNKYMPTYGEIRKALEYKNDSSVTQYIQYLEKKGFISTTGGVRGIVLNYKSMIFVEPEEFWFKNEDYK